MADELRSTAQVLGRFQKELLDEGIDAESAKYLTQTAGRELIASIGVRLRIKKEVGRDG